jgi:hypothetical protein
MLSLESFMAEESLVFLDKEVALVKQEDIC